MLEQDFEEQQDDPTKGAAVDELTGAIRNEETHALGRYTGTLAKERATLMDYYLGKPFGNEEDGKSSVVSTDVSDTVESILPSLIKMFVGGDEIGEFNPVGPEDEDAARQETEYTNFVITQQNHSFTTFYSWFKDALLQKNGYVKYWWDYKDERKKERYEGLTDNEFAMLLQDAGIEPVQHQSYPDPIASQIMQQMPMQGQPQQVPMLHDVVVQITRPMGYVCIEPVPPEEILIAARAKSINVKDAPFVQHRTRKSISDIRAMGYDVPETISDEDDQINNLEYLARRSPEESLFSTSTVVGEGASREVLLKETWIRYDFDGDGIAELRRVVQVGATILENEETEEVNICCLSPILMPHKHFGRSVGELVADIQLIKSTLLRQQLDNLYLSNAPRIGVNTQNNAVNLDDLLTSRAGGLIRVNGNPAEHLMPFGVPDVAAQSMPMMEFLQGVMENRTGITRYNQGLDANSLNKTASGINQIMSAAMEKQLLIARCFAETGVKDLFVSVHGLLRRHSTKQQTVKLRNKWVDINPRDWRERSDLTVSVGLGTGNKQEQTQQLMMIINAQKEAMQIGATNPEKIYNSLVELTKNAGFKNPDKFWINPAQMKPQPPKPDPKIQVAQIGAQADIQTEQIKQQGETQRQAMQLHHDAAAAFLDYSTPFFQPQQAPQQGGGM
jgi:hypothetical protein